MPLSSFVVPNSNTILQNMLQDYQAQMQTLGYSVSIAPGSEVYIRFQSIANQFAVLYNVDLQQLNARMIDSASGSDLDRLALQFGLVRRGATVAQGFITLLSAASQTLTTTMSLTGANSLVYQVAQAGVYAPNALVPVVSVDTGSQTNLPVNTILTWITALPNTQSTTPVSVAITGGQDAEDDATLRARLLQTLQNPAGAGNAAQLVRLGQSVDPLVQSAFVYSNYNGAGTQLVALTGYQTTSYIGRDIPHVATDNTNNLALSSPPYNNYTLPNSTYPLSNSQGGNSLNGGAYNYGSNLANDTSGIYGNLAASFANPYASAITTVNNAPVNLALKLSLPFPVGAPQNGTGGGWVDFTTFPNPDGYWIGGTNYSGYKLPQILSVTGLVSATSSTPAGYQITIAAATGSSADKTDGYCTTPTAGVTHINWINRSDALDNGWTVVQATILSATNNKNNTWTLILDTPLTFGTDSNGYSYTDFYGNTGAVAGDFIFPASTNAQNYLDTVLQSFAGLGPGQVTTQLGLLALGATRVPSASAVFPSTIGVQFTKSLLSDYAEMFDANFYYNGATDTSGTFYNSSSPGSPVAGAPPNIWIPYQLGFYDQTGVDYL